MEKIEAMRVQARKAFEQKDYTRAEELLNLLVKDDQDWSHFLLRGRVFLELNSLDKALRDFTRIIKQANQRSSAELVKCFYFRGLVYKKQGLQDQARDDFRAAAESSASSSYGRKAQQELESTGSPTQTEQDTFLKKFKQKTHMWAVVESEWFAQWLSHVGLSNEALGKDFPVPSEHSARPGRILNAKKLKSGVFPAAEQNDHEYGIVLKSHLQRPRDFVLLPKGAFEYLESVYTCDCPIYRRGTSASVPAQLEQGRVVYSSDGQCHDEIVQFYRDDTVDSLKQRILPCLDIEDETRLWLVNTQVMSLAQVQAICLNGKSESYIDGKLLRSANSLGKEVSVDPVILLDICTDNRFWFTNQLAKKKGCEYCQSENLKSPQQKYCNESCKESAQKVTVQTTTAKPTPKSKNKTPKPTGKSSFLTFFCCGRNRNSSNHPPRSLPQKPKKTSPKPSRPAAESTTSSLAPSQAPSLSPNLEPQKLEGGDLSGKFSKDESKQGSTNTSEHAVLQPTTRLSSTLEQPGRGLLGLKNLGNTCYMNSALQCLSYTLELTDYFMKSTYLTQLKASGSKGRMCRAYFEVLQSLWGRGSSACNPRAFKSALCKYNALFDGYEQHDAHEFLCTILDLLHSELNTAKKLKFKDDPELESQPADIVGQHMWSRHMSQNQSVFMEKFHGQYKSTVYCPKCQKESCAFDPFMCLSLPIPQGNVAAPRLRVYFVHKALKSGTEALIIENPPDSLEELSEEIQDAVNVTSFLLIEVENNSFKTVVESEVPEKGVYAYEWTATPEESLVIELVFKKPRQSEYFCHPRLITCSPRGSLKDLHFRVFELLKPILPRTKSTQTAFEETQNKDLYLLTFSSNCPLCKRQTCSGCNIDCSDQKIETFHQASTHLKVVVTFTQRAVTSRVDFTFLERVRAPYVIGRRAVRSAAAVDIYDCFRYSSQPETLDRHNAWRCLKCKNNVEATKRLEIYRVPELLIIQLKRFKTRGSFREKLRAAVKFPQTGLDLSQFVVGGSTGLYDLYAVCHHTGSLTGGHYVAQCYNYAERTWYEFNDSHVREDSSISNNSAYLLFYRLRK